MENLVLIVLCLLINGLLAGAEMAFISVNKAGVRELARRGYRKAEVLLRLRERPERTLSVIQIGITLVGALAAAVGGASADEWLGPILGRSLGFQENTADLVAIASVVLILTYFSVVIGELVPKSLALRHPLAIAQAAAPWLLFCENLLNPFVTALEWSTKWVLRLLGFGHRRTDPRTPESDIVDDTIGLAGLSTHHRQYILNLVDLERKQVNDVYLRWPQVVAVDIHQSPQEVESVVISSGHTRLPVRDNSHVIGILNTKEFIALRASGGENWTALLRPASQVMDQTPLLAGLRYLQERRVHMGIVYSGAIAVGIVTLEDILEEVIGEIYDEDDDGALRGILSSSPRTRGQFTSHLQDNR